MMPHSFTPIVSYRTNDTSETNDKYLALSRYLTFVIYHVSAYFSVIKKSTPAFLSG